MEYQVGQIIKAVGGRLGKNVIDVEIYKVGKTTLGVHYEGRNAFGTFTGNATIRLDGRGAHVVVESR